MKRFRQMMAYLAVSVLALVLMSLAVAAPAQASSVQHVSASPASGLAGNGDTYTVNFMMATGLARGGTITLAFPAGFNLASVTAANVQLTYAGTVFTVNSVQVSGTTLTFPNPGVGGPFGTMYAGNPVSVQVGGVTNPTTAGPYTLKVSTQTDTTPVSASFAINGQAATALTVTGQQNMVAGDSFTLTINATDKYGNVDPSYTGDKLVTFSGPFTATNGNVPTAHDKTGTDVAFGTATTVSFSGGTATTVVKAYAAAPNQFVAATQGALVGVSGNFNVTPAPVTALKLTGQQNIQAGGSFPLIIEADDAYGNPNAGGVNNFTGPQMLNFSGPGTSPNGTRPTAQNNTGANVNFGFGTYVTFTNGTASTRVTAYSAGTNQQVFASIGSVSGASGSFNVTGGAASRYSLTGVADQPAGGSFTLSLSATDAYGNPDTSVTGDQTLTFSGPAASPNNNQPTAKDKSGTAVNFGTTTTVSFSGGTATSQITVYGAGAGQTVSVADSAGRSGTSDTFTVSSGTATALAVTGAPQTIVAGGSFTLTLTAADQYGNAASSYAGDQTLQFSNLAASPNHKAPTARDKSNADIPFGSGTVVTFTGGVGTSQIAAYAVGTNQSIKVSDGTFTATTGSFNIRPGLVSSVTLTPAATTTVAGTPLPVTVQVFDVGGNPANYSVVTLSSPTDSSFKSPAAYTYTSADAGSHSFSVTFNTPGTQTLTATASPQFGYTPGSQALTATTATQFINTPGSQTLTASTLTLPLGVTGSVTITVTSACIPRVNWVDVSGPATVAAGQSAAFSATGSSACAGPQSTTFTWSATGGTFTPGGVWTASTKPGTYTVTATAANGVPGTATVQVTPGPAAKVTVTAAGSSTGAGNSVAFSAAVTDAYGNAVTGTPVTWSATDGVVTQGGLWTAPTKAGTYTVTATIANGLAGTAQMNVVPGPAARVTVTPASSSVAAGRSAAFSAALTDAYGNAVTSSPVTWSATGGTISSEGIFTAAQPGTGKATATIQSINGPVSGSATITITGALADNGTGGTGGNHDTGGSPVVTSDRGTVADQAQPTPAGATVLTQPVVIGASGTVTATFHVPNAPQEPDTLVYYWDANLKHWIAVPTTFGPDGFVAQVPAGAPVSLMRGTVRQSSDTLTSWANPFVLKAQSLGLLSGMPDGAFHPDDAVTRYQMAAVVALAAGLDVTHADRSVLSKLSDADQIPEWARPYVAATLSSGLMVGNGDGFAGDRPLTRAQVVSLLGRLLPNGASAPLHFTDNDSIPSWAQGGLAKAVAANIIAGMADGAFHPDEPLTRAQIATLMAKFMDYAAAHR